MRARRLVPIAAVAVLGVTVLSGCRTDPAVAAYVGDHRITESAVDQVLDDLRQHGAGASADPSAAPQQVAELPTRAQVVSTLVLREACQRVAAEKGYQATNQIPAEQAAQQLGLPAGTAYPRQVAELYSCLSGLPVPAPQPPSAQELTDLVAAGKAAGVIPAQVSTQEAASQLDGDQLRGALAQKRGLADAIKDADITVNPRYRPLDFPLLSFTGDTPAVSVPLGDADSGAVTDLPVTAQPVAPAA
ncbi:hypothetical protein [Plantactinospora sp. KBS50]|uniref:hypothetical protein n=1 Tax=Plantactinospora sp. KBS50 TaxID=2024580 RepID=UPI000BAB1FA1|nr:hypothetical protein [Plantactinospora sp. KBS50]ASW53665.1 hypothetical protein CIK06_04850 [Plantactinospora sp. KBS50]